MIVMKFGGTSVQDAAAINRLIKIVSERSGSRLVVVSALAGVTDVLVQLCAQVREHAPQPPALAQLRERHLNLCQALALPAASSAFVNATCDALDTFVAALCSIGELTDRSRDRVLATGELLSSRIVSDAFIRAGSVCRLLDSRAMIRTGPSCDQPQVDLQATQASSRRILQEAFRETELALAAGFIAADDAGNVTTLGRGGSDYSAALLGAALDAERIEIWTDVDGVLSADPRIVPAARLVPRLSFDEAAELAYFGAKVLHPATILPAVQRDIAVWVKNSRNPQCSGSEITRLGVKSAEVVKAIACKAPVIMLNIYSTRMLGAAGFLARLFEAFARERVSIDLISTSEVNVSLTLDRNTSEQALERVLAELSQFSSVTLERDCASIALVGIGMRQTAGLAERIFNALQGINVSMVSMGASDVNFSLVIDQAHLGAAMQQLHTQFFAASADRLVDAA